jgi:hypothetical protein
VQGDIVIMKHKFTYYFCKKANEVGLAVSMDVIDEVREQAHIRNLPPSRGQLDDTTPA